MSEIMSFEEKLAKLSPELRSMIDTGGREYTPGRDSPISDFLVRTKKHCNGGATVDSGLWLKNHCNSGGKIVLSMAGAGSSFEMGITISELIRADKIAAKSVTAANFEEDFYQLFCHESYVYIPKYAKLTPAQEKELDNVGLRRITDTLLPEEETVRIILPYLIKLWQEAEEKGERYFWHEYFFQIFEKGLIEINPVRAKNSWVYQAWKKKIPIFVPGVEDSTMGNIFSSYSYYGYHPDLIEFKQPEPISINIIKHSFEYLHAAAEWYLDTKKTPLAFLQLGGGIAGDFLICVVPHLKKDYYGDETLEYQESNVPSWKAFIENTVSPMSVGSYSGAGFDEKITWGKVGVDSYGRQIFGDYTEHFPDIVALILGW